MPAESATEALGCAACVIVNRTPELEDGEWIDAKLVAASVLLRG